VARRACLAAALLRLRWLRAAGRTAAASLAKPVPVQQAPGPAQVRLLRGNPAASSQRAGATASLF
jgi:hypothetical protein